MFDFIRSHQRLMQLVLLVLILPSFVLIGVSGYSNYVSGDEDLVKVGDEAVTLQEFDQARRNQLAQMQQSSPSGFDPAVLDTPAARSAVLESLIDRRVIIQVASKEKFSVSDTALRQAIAAMPLMQENGQFSPQRYNEVLASAGLTTREFEQGQRAELALNRVLQPVSATADIPPTVIENIKRALSEERRLRMEALPAEDFASQVEITDADIKAWYESNQNALRLPEQVSAQYLVLDEEAALAALPEIPEEQLRDYYEQNKSLYVQPPRVNVSHIQVNVPEGATEAERAELHAKAQALAERAQAAPDEFADIASAESQDLGTARDGGKLGWITQGAWSPELESVIFSLTEGQVSNVVQGPGGLHIFKANEVQPERGESFEEARGKVEEEVRHQLAAERYADMATKLTDLVYDNPDSLQVAADTLGLEIRSAAGITRDGLLASDEVPANAASSSQDAALLDDVRVRRALFSPAVFTEKNNSGVIEISPGTMLVVRVDMVTPPHVPDLAMVEPRIRETLQQERALEAAYAAGEKRLAEYRAGTVEDLPETLGDPLTVSRINPQGLAQPVLDAAFQATPQGLPQYLGIEGPQGYVIVRLEAVEAGDTNHPMLAFLAEELVRLWGTAQEQAVLTRMRDLAKVELLPEGQAALRGETDDDE